MNVVVAGRVSPDDVDVEVPVVVWAPLVVCEADDWVPDAWLPDPCVPDAAGGCAAAEAATAIDNAAANANRFHIRSPSFRQ